MQQPRCIVGVEVVFACRQALFCKAARMTLLAARRASRTPNRCAMRSAGQRHGDPLATVVGGDQPAQPEAQSPRFAAAALCAARQSCTVLAGTHCPFHAGEGLSLRVRPPRCIRYKGNHTPPLSVNRFSSATISAASITRLRRCATPRGPVLAASSSMRNAVQRTRSFSHITRPRGNDCLSRGLNMSASPTPCNEQEKKDYQNEPPQEPALSADSNASVFRLVFQLFRIFATSSSRGFASSTRHVLLQQISRRQDRGHPRHNEVVWPKGCRALHSIPCTFLSLLYAKKQQIAWQLIHIHGRASSSDDSGAHAERQRAPLMSEGGGAPHISTIEHDGRRG